MCTSSNTYSTCFSFLSSCAKLHPDGFSAASHWCDVFDTVAAECLLLTKFLICEQTNRSSHVICFTVDNGNHTGCSFKARWRAGGSSLCTSVKEHWLLNERTLRHKKQQKRWIMSVLWSKSLGRYIFQKWKCTKDVGRTFPINCLQGVTCSCRPSQGAKVVKKKGNKRTSK